MTDHLQDARESAAETYDRRRARAAADILATIPPARWDAMTRNVIATLAGRAPIPVRPLEPSWCDGQLGYGIRCGLPADHAGTCDPDSTDTGPYGIDGPGTTDIRVAFAAEIDRMGLTAEQETLGDRFPNLAEHYPNIAAMPATVDNAGCPYCMDDGGKACRVHARRAR